jgi:hypothetical protein
MILVNLLSFIFYVTSLMCFVSLKSFKAFLSACLIARLFSYKPIGAVNINASTHF